MKNRFRLIIFFVFAACVTHAQPGTLDSSFGTHGRLKLMHGDNLLVHALCVQPDGKILVGGSFRKPDTLVYPTFTVIAKHMVPLIQRYNKNGSIDSSFGYYGEKILPYIKSGNQTGGGEATQINQIHLLADGSMYLTADNKNYQWEQDDDGNNYVETVTDYLIYKLQPNGALDNSFNKNGYIQSDYFFDDFCGFQNDGKIVVPNLYYTRNSSYPPIYSTALNRYNKDGSLDSTFGTNGLDSIPDLGRTVFDRPFGFYIKKILVLKDQKIIIAGIKIDSISDGGDRFYNYNFDLVRLNTDGRVDLSFGKNGYAITKVSNTFQSISQSQFFTQGLDDVLPLDVNEMSDGSLIVSGTSAKNNSGQIFTTIKYDANGSVNTDFGTNGIAVNKFSSYNFSIPCSNIILNDGTIIVAGTAYNNLVPFYSVFVVTDPVIALAALDQNGNADNGFGDNGTVTSVITPRDTTSTAQALAVSDDGNLFAAATIGNFNRSNPEDTAKNIGGYLLKYKLSTATKTAKNVFTVAQPSTLYHIFPNPAKDVLQIDGLSLQNKKQIEIIDVNGKTLQQVSTSADTYKLNINNLAPGLYILKVMDGSKTTSSKFIKE